MSCLLRFGGYEGRRCVGGRVLWGLGEVRAKTRAAATASA